MTKLEELRSFVSSMFDKCTDTEMIKQSAIIGQKINELEEEQTKQQSEYKELLTDYKDMVLHSSYKPKANETIGQQVEDNKPFDFDSFANEWINNKKK